MLGRFHIQHNFKMFTITGCVCSLCTVYGYAYVTTNHRRRLGAECGGTDKILN